MLEQSALPSIFRDVDRILVTGLENSHSDMH
jgi:hypothetical protein